MPRDLSPMTRTIVYETGKADAGLKISTFLRRRGYSRQCLIELKKTEGSVTLDGVPVHFDARLGECSVLAVRIIEPDPVRVRPVLLPFSLLYEDEDIAVVSKAAGMPLHPSYHNTDNTLANAMTEYYARQGIAFVFRCSNRLDRDTSGLTVVSRHYLSAAVLSGMGEHREISREYLALAEGFIDPPEGTIDLPLGRKNSSLIEREVDPVSGERAVTHYRVISYFRVPGTNNGFTLLRLKLETGRTHQIRVHMQAIGHPLLGDTLYGNSRNSDSLYGDSLYGDSLCGSPSQENAGRPTGSVAAPQLISRQALHAWRLRFDHPVTGQPLSFTSPLPEDMRRVIASAERIRSRQ